MLTKAFVALALAVVVAQATPAPVSDELFVIKTETTPFGDLVFYGAASNLTSSKRSDFEARACGTNNVQCFGSNIPNLASCQHLVSVLSASGGTVLGTSPRSVCLTLSGNQCCTSWADVAPGVTDGDLASAAEDVLAGCVENNQSGVARNVNLNGICTTQCLSNRATGCTD